MTSTIAEYPHAAKPAYSYDPAKALDYFTDAGYAKDADGNLSKDGEKLVITVGIGGDGVMDHPTAPILTQMANDLEQMGAELIIQDVDFPTLVNLKDSGELDMWVMAWNNATDCDLTQVFGSESPDNDVHLKSKELDKLMAQVLKTVDYDERCKLVAEELDLIMDEAVVMPIYQRKNKEIFNASTIKLDTLPEEATTYWNYSAQINKLEMK
jgi:peptide/nickel transport system substrate-binding protein